MMREPSEVWENLLRVIEPQARTAFMGAPELTDVGWRAQFFIPSGDETPFRVTFAQLYNVQHKQGGHALTITPVVGGPVHLTRDRVIELAGELLDALLEKED